MSCADTHFCPLPVRPPSLQRPTHYDACTQQLLASWVFLINMTRRTWQPALYTEHHGRTYISVRGSRSALAVPGRALTRCMCLALAATGERCHPGASRADSAAHQLSRCGAGQWGAVPCSGLRRIGGLHGCEQPRAVPGETPAQAACPDGSSVAPCATPLVCAALCQSCVPILHCNIGSTAHTCLTQCGRSLTRGVVAAVCCRPRVGLAPPCRHPRHRHHRRRPHQRALCCALSPSRCGCGASPWWMCWTVTALDWRAAP